VRLEAFEEVATLFRQFIAAAGNGHGVNGIARVLQQHTGKVVIVEDSSGHVIATGDPDPGHAAPAAPWIMRPLPQHASHGVATLDMDRWVAVARPRGETLGAISLLDSGEPVTGVDLFELEQAATVLGWELLHSRSVAEAELALWGDFTTELFEDSDAGRVRSHAHRLGYDLDQMHRVVLVMPLGAVSPELRETVRRTTARLGVDCLVTTRSNGVALVVARELRWVELAGALRSECGCKLRIAVGGRYRLEDLSKSLADAEFTLRITSSSTDRPVAIFDELGVWRLLARPDARDLQDLVEHWIGKLIAYDREHRSELLKTLVSYLNEFGVLEATAARLYVHRNTLKYRLVRIGEVTGWDLNDPEHRFHLDLACRAWLVRQALEGAPPQPRDARVARDGEGPDRTSAARVSTPVPEVGGRAATVRKGRPTTSFA
jgi:hypothetical protein